MPSVSVSSNTAAVSRRLHTAAADVPRALNSAAQRALQGLPDRLRGSALATLPRRGGLNTAVARSRFSIHRLPNGARIVAQNEYDIVGLNHGTAVHPLYGDTRHWYRESVKPGWWDKVLDTVEPAARREMEQGLATIAREAGG